MKSNIILILLVVSCILGGIFTYQKVTVLEARYETLKESNIRLQLNKPLSANQIKERQFKEEMYIRQQERDTTLILGFFSAFSIIVGLFTFRSVREEFVNKWKEISQANESTKTEIENKYIEIAHKYKILEVENNIKMGKNYSSKAGPHFESNVSIYLFYRLKAIDCYIIAITAIKDESDFYKKPIINYYEDLVKNLTIRLKNTSAERIGTQGKIPNELHQETLDMMERVSNYFKNTNWDHYTDFAIIIPYIKFED